MNKLLYKAARNEVKKLKKEIKEYTEILKKLRPLHFCDMSIIMRKACLYEKINKLKKELNHCIAKAWHYRSQKKQSLN